jgi:hypothetical protein
MGCVDLVDDSPVLAVHSIPRNCSRYADKERSRRSHTLFFSIRKLFLHTRLMLSSAVFRCAVVSKVESRKTSMESLPSRRLVYLKLVRHAACLDLCLHDRHSTFRYPRWVLEATVLWCDFLEAVFRNEVLLRSLIGGCPARIPPNETQGPQSSQYGTEHFCLFFNGVLVKCLSCGSLSHIYIANAIREN